MFIFDGSPSRSRLYVSVNPDPHIDTAAVPALLSQEKGVFSTDCESYGIIIGLTGGIYPRPARGVSSKVISFGIVSARIFAWMFYIYIR